MPIAFHPELSLRGFEIKPSHNQNSGPFMEYGINSKCRLGRVCLALKPDFSLRDFGIKPSHNTKKELNELTERERKFFIDKSTG